MPTIATMFNSRLPPHSMAGNTTKTVQSSYLEDGFPTNGQAKELPIPRKKRLWRDVPRTNCSLPNKAGNPFSQGIKETSDMPPPVLWDLYPSAR